MATPTYDVGDAVEAGVTFRNTAVPPVPTDPTDVTLTVRIPDGSVTVHPMGTLNHPSAGVFAKTVVAAAPGIHVLRWVGTGAVVATVEQLFGARPLSVQGFLLGFYGDNPVVSATDQLRLLLGDTSDSPILTANALASLLADTADVDGRPTTATVVRGFLAMAAKYAPQIDGSTGDNAKSYSQRTAAFRAMADAYRKAAEDERVAAAAAAALTPPLPMAGGIDRDLDFAVGMWDTPGTSQYGGGWPDPRSYL